MNDRAGNVRVAKTQLPAKRPYTKTGVYVKSRNGLKLRDERVRRMVRKMFLHMRWLEPSDKPACHAWAELEVLAQRVLRGATRSRLVECAG